jgi:hypothetical protein
MKGAKSKDPVAVPAALKPILEALAGQSVSVEPGWGASNIVLKARGKIFLIFTGDELVYKLPKGRVDELVAAEQGRRFDPRRDGRLMKEWVVLPAKLSNLVKLAREAHTFATSPGKRARTKRASRTP